MPGEFGFNSRLNVWCYLWSGIFPLATDEEIEPDDLFRTKTPKVIKETFLGTKKQVWNWNTTWRKELMKTVTVHCSLLWVLSKEVEIQVPRASNLVTKYYFLNCGPQVPLQELHPIQEWKLRLAGCNKKMVPARLKGDPHRVYNLKGNMVQWLSNA